MIDRRLACLGLLSGAALPAARASGEAGAPLAPRLQFAYEAQVLLSPDVPHGRTPYGERTRAPIIGGEFKGPDIAGQVLAGGADWQLLRADGYFVLEADYFMQASDGTQIRVHNKGLWHSATGDWPADYAVTVPEFEVPIGRHDWLNRHVFVGTVGPGLGKAPSVTVRVFKALA